MSQSLSAPAHLFGTVAALVGKVSLAEFTNILIDFKGDVPRLQDNETIAAHVLDDCEQIQADRVNSALFTTVLA